ncbi:DNA-3-methyladenine glycosylase [Noviherbaspirillum galbum]|uniref:Putative 3-methyladenine DNA glycosylase n=1 Tax=Noviherbaspirillum galbum TaxID=2709383 RepID=A0A6B3SVK2_9BURK|nr:DNA-3-methyladenine glycosylase [Noviherbaspirillum galbum]NEX64558.1 DNA-3-methyladenine glycosylase [Noviherbaspirillum galbum]
MAKRLAILPRDFYARDTEEVARALLGMELVHLDGGIERRGRIVETEAYVGAHDLASHSSKGITPRTRVMYGPPGHAYVYLIYGMHHCMNVVTEPEGRGCAVLLRALEPVAGVEGNTRGPGLLCRAMGIDRRLDGADMCAASGRSLWVEETGTGDGGFTIAARPRIGVAYAKEWADAPLRFTIEGNAFLSRK